MCSSLVHHCVAPPTSGLEQEQHEERGHLYSTHGRITVHCVFVAMSTDGVVNVWCDQFIAFHRPTDYITPLLAASPSVAYITRFEAIVGIVCEDCVWIHLHCIL